MTRRVTLAIAGLTGVASVSGDWRIILGSAIGTFVAYLSGAIVSKDSIRKALEVHESSCLVRASRPALTPVPIIPPNGNGLGPGV